MNDISTRSKAVGLFKYLAEIARLRSRPVTSIDSYESVLWLHDIPELAECSVSLRGPEPDTGMDTWLQISKPDLQPPPALPEALFTVVSFEQIRNFEREPNVPPETWTNRESLQRAWQDYLSKRWCPWAAERKTVEIHHRAYSRLYAMYQQVLRQGELFELILAVGFLRWETKSGNRVKRHLLSLPISIELEERTGRLIVGPSTESSDVRLEQDMLEPLERPEGSIQAQIGNVLDELGTQSLLRSKSSDILRTWVNNVSSQGVLTFPL